MTYCNAKRDVFVLSNTTRSNASCKSQRDSAMTKMGECVMARLKQSVVDTCVTQCNFIAINACIGSLRDTNQTSMQSTTT
jgi:hypothetical protein